MNGPNENLVTAVIITYKRPLHILERAIRSALNQTHCNLEIIVVNDNPDDLQSVREIGSLIESMKDNRLRYIVHDKNFGACVARNTGIKASKGEYVALLDDDDEWLPEKIESQLLGFVSNKVGLVYSPFYNISDKLPGEITVRGTKSGDLLHELLWTNCLGGSSMTLMKRDVFDVCGFFDDELLSSQDYDMWIRIAKKYEINCINIPLTRRFLLEESITKNFQKQKQGFNLLSKKHINLYEAFPAAYNYRLNRRANKWIEQGHFKSALDVYLIALKIKPFSSYNFLEPVKGVVKFVIKRY